MKTPHYVGRFAPSPTGLLHFGSLVAALGSYLDARSNNGTWLVRVDDVDQGRVKPGVTDAILSTLDAFGFEWDGEIVTQSQRSSRYQAALDRLAAKGDVFACGCTRKDFAGSIYPGTCRRGLNGKPARSVRMRVDTQAVYFDDVLQGRICQSLQSDVGDFVIRRADGYFAYHLATVVDDWEQNVTHVVRGCDLADSTPRQIFLQRALGYTTPSYAHLPVVVNTQGNKLSKHTAAPAVCAKDARKHLSDALRVLGQKPELAHEDLSLRELWDWAVEHWAIQNVPKTKEIPAPR